MRPIVKLALGGVTRELRIPIGVSLAIEDATGLGFLELSSMLFNQRAKLSHALAVVRIAYAENGIAYTDAEMLEFAEKDGIVGINVLACRVMNELFRKPAGASAEGNGKRAKSPEPISQ